MKLKIKGLVFATLEPVVEELTVDFSKDVKLDIVNKGELSILTVNDSQYYLETSSLEYELA